MLKKAKKGIVALLVLSSLGVMAGCGDDKKKDEASPPVQTEQATATAKDESVTPEAKIKNKIAEYAKEYTDTTIDNITINDDLGTEKEGDYVVLVNLTWNTKNSGKTSQEMLDMYSSDMAARMHSDLPEVQELAVFWTVPYLNNGSAKVSFERTEKGMKYTHKVFDKNFK